MSVIRVPSRGGFGGLNPHQNHLDPHFIWPWVQWTLCIDLSQAGSNFSYGILKSLVCWWPHSSFVLYNVIRKYNICSRIKCQLVTCAQHDPASTPESGFAVTNENKITPKRTNILRMYLLNCCFGLNKNDDFDNYESTINGEPYMWRNQDDHWDVTLDFNLCGTAQWTDIHHQWFIYLFYLFYLNHYLNHWWLIYIVTFVTKNNGNNFLTLEQLHTFFKLFFFKLWFYSPILFTMDMISVLIRKSIVRGPRLVKIHWD